MLTNKQEIKIHYTQLIAHLDELTAYYIKDTNKLPSKTTIIELMQWAHKQKGTS